MREDWLWEKESSALHHIYYWNEYLIFNFFSKFTLLLDEMIYRYAYLTKKSLAIIHLIFLSLHLFNSSLHLSLSLSLSPSLSLSLTHSLLSSTSLVWIWISTLNFQLILPTNMFLERTFALYKRDCFTRNFNIG